MYTQYNVVFLCLCTLKLAFGWIQNTLEGNEQVSSYTVQTGYAKGRGNTVDVRVELVQDPQASFHASEFIGLHCEFAFTQSQLLFNTCISDTSDFGRSIFIPTAVRNSRFTPTNVSITLAVDNVANEGIERGILRMRISEDIILPSNTFFKRDLAVAINDTTSE